MNIRWSQTEQDNVLLKAAELMKQAPKLDHLRAIQTAQTLVLPTDRQRPIRWPSNITHFIPMVDSLLAKLGSSVRPVLAQTPMPTPPEDPKRRLAREIAAQRVHAPTAEFIVIYNNAREKITPQLQEVTSVKYLPNDVMNMVLEELDMLTHPQAVPAELTQEERKAIAIGEGMVALIQNAAASVIEKLIESRIGRLNSAIDERISKVRSQLETDMLSLMEQEPKNGHAPAPPTPAPQPVGQTTAPASELNLPEPPAVNHVTPTPAPAPKPAPIKPTGVFKVLAVDSMMPKMQREIEMMLPANVRFSTDNADHAPHGTLKQVHYLLVTRRTPRNWINAYAKIMSRARILDLGSHDGIEGYVNKLNEISHNAWFSV